jgi:hypothetical protein
MEAWKNPKVWIKDLNKIIVKAKTSPKLREAACEAIKAIQTSNWNLAYQITAAKSYITGTLDPKDKTHAFQENHEANEKALGSSVYCIMDGIHHAIAFSIDELPSGMATGHLANPHGTIRNMKSKGTHPIVRRIKYEHRMIQEDVARKIKERTFEEPLIRKVNWK